MHIATLVLGVLGVAISAEGSYRAVPLLQKSDDGVKIAPQARQLLSTMQDGVDVLAIVEVDSKAADLTNIYMQYLAKDDEVKPKSFDNVNDEPMWMIASPAAGDKRAQVILVVSIDDQRAVTNATRIAYSIMASLSQFIVVHLPTGLENDGDIGETLQRLTAEADLTHRNAHMPKFVQSSELPEGAQFTTEYQVDSNWLTSMVPILAVVSGLARPLGTDREKVIRALKPVVDGKPVSSFKSAECMTIPFFDANMYVPPFEYGKSDLKRYGPEVAERMKAFSATVEKTLENRDKLLWTVSGEHFTLWLEYVKKRVAPELVVDTNTPFVTEVLNLGKKRALERYNYEMEGAISHGWLVRDDGSTVRAIAYSKEEQAAKDEDASKALANSGVSPSKLKLKPPTASSLERLHKAAVKRTEDFLKRFLVRVTEHTKAVQQVNSSIAKAFEGFKEKNNKQIMRFIKSVTEDIEMNAVSRIKQVQSRLPARREALDEVFASAAKTANGDLSTCLDDLSTSHEAEDRRAAMAAKLKETMRLQHAENEKIIKKKLLHIAAVAKQKAEEHAPARDTAYGKKALLSILQKGESAAYTEWEKLLQELYKGTTWTEREQLTEAIRKEKLEASIFQLKKTAEAANKQAIRQTCGLRAADVLKKFTDEVIYGKALKYPASEGAIFDAAAGQASTMLKDFTKTLNDFSDMPIFREELNKLEAKLQLEICGGKHGEGVSVMSQNIESIALQPWVASAMSEAQAKLGNDDDARGKGGRLLRESLQKQSKYEYNELSANMRQRLTNYWCKMQFGGDCTDGCMDWSAGSAFGLIYLLDVMALCEPSWCNWRLGGDQQKGELWKVGEPFRRCAVIEEKPCPSFWDRKGRYFMKVIIRIVLLLSVLFQGVTIYARRQPRRSKGAKMQKTPGSAKKNQ